MRKSYYIDEAEDGTLYLLYGHPEDKRICDSVCTDETGVSLIMASGMSRHLAEELLDGLASGMSLGQVEELLCGLPQ